jgi:hypothetical protein
MENEVTFLLKLLNQIAPAGRLEDGDDNFIVQGMIHMRLLSQGLIIDHNRMQGEWFTHPNTGTGHWDR